MALFKIFHVFYISETMKEEKNTSEVCNKVQQNQSPATLL